MIGVKQEKQFMYKKYINQSLSSLITQTINIKLATVATINKNFKSTDKLLLYVTAHPMTDMDKVKTSDNQNSQLFIAAYFAGRNRSIQSLRSGKRFVEQPFMNRCSKSI